MEDKKGGMERGRWRECVRSNKEGGGREGVRREGRDQRGR